MLGSMLSIGDQQMFWGRRKKTAQNEHPQIKDDENLNNCIAILRHLGFSANPYGIGVMTFQLEKYSTAEIAVNIAILTLARDIRDREDVESLVNISIHAIKVAEIMKEFRDRGMMRQSVWQNDTIGLAGIMKIDSEQLEWCERILSDPVGGRVRLADSIIEY